MAKHAVNGIDIHYQIDGDISDKTIMFSNSLASTLNMWDLQIEHLLARGLVLFVTIVEVMGSQKRQRDLIQ